MKNLYDMTEQVRYLKDEVHDEYTMQRIFPSLILAGCYIEDTGMSVSVLQGATGLHMAEMQTKLFDTYMDFMYKIDDLVSDGDFYVDLCRIMKYLEPVSEHCSAELCPVCIDRLRTFYHQEITPYVIAPLDEYDELIQKACEGTELTYEMGSVFFRSDFTRGGDISYNVQFTPEHRDELTVYELEMRAKYPMSYYFDNRGWMSQRNQTSPPMVSLGRTIAKNSNYHDDDPNDPSGKLNDEASIYHGMPFNAMADVFDMENGGLMFEINQYIDNMTLEVEKARDSYLDYIISEEAFFKWMRASAQCCSC